MKRILTTLVIIILTINLFGCNKASKNEEKKTTIKFSTFYSEKSEQKIVEVYKNIIDEFQKKHSDIKVEFTTDYADENKIKSDVSNGEVDLIGLKRQQVIEFAKEGLLKDLSSFFTEKGLDKNMYSVSLAYGLYNDKIYGYNDMPLTIEFFYNADMFKKYGVAEPKDLNELIDVCSKLKSKGITSMEVGALDNWTLAILFSQINAQTTGSIEVTSKYAADKKGYMELKDINKSFEIYQQIINKALSKSSIDINYKQSLDDFVKGKVAILPAGAWAKSFIDENKPSNFNYNVFEDGLKFINEPVSVFAGAGGQTIAIPEKSKLSKEALTFLEFLLSDESQKKFVEAGYISPLGSANKNDSELQARILNHLNSTDKNSVLFMDNIPVKMADTLTRVLLDMAEGRVKYNEAWERILKITFQQ